VDAIKRLAELAIMMSEYEPVDLAYVENEIRTLVGCEAIVGCAPNACITDVVDAMMEDIQKRDWLASIRWTYEMMETKLYNFITPRPSTINRVFWQKYQDSPVAATTQFYEQSKMNNYIKVHDITRNIMFQYESKYGQLDITINLAKPEKDPLEIAKIKDERESDFPACQLCIENEGFVGRVDYPARSNHRVVRLAVQNESWGLQYSPYAYYEEHCIFFNIVHQPMVIKREVFEKILFIVKMFPHYFVGSNADLPLVGGSILTHEHFQGGKDNFPMARASIRRAFKLNQFPEVKGGILAWPMSVIRISCATIAPLVDAATHIYQRWCEYNDDTVDIIAHASDGTLHHTITPIARKKNDVYELDLVLRDNHTNDTHPEGVFHPHADLHHIKKENIGLIEVLGLAILPPRLKKELEEVEAYIKGDWSHVAPIHHEWADTLKARYTNDIDSKAFIQRAVGEKYVRVLEDAGVFKLDGTGIMAFDRFIAFLNDTKGRAL